MVLRNSSRSFSHSLAPEEFGGTLADVFHGYFALEFCTVHCRKAHEASVSRDLAGPVKWTASQVSQTGVVFLNKKIGVNMYKEETEMKASFGIQLIRLTLFLCALTYLLKTLSLVKFFADPQDVVSGSPSFVNLASMVGGTLCINGLVVFFSMRGLAHIKQKRAETLKFIRRYMLWMFFIYPITNLLAGALYVPIYSAEGFEAYMLNSFDKFRYVWFASLYLVVIFDKRLKAYFIEVAEAPRNLLTRH